MNNYSNPVTVTGNPASFEASGSGKLLSLSVPFSPIQDLHGYANPWSAGGGKNLLNPATMEPGYLESSGNVHAQGNQKEYYSTEYYEVGSQASISVGYNAFASTESKWIAINWYDANKTNLSRATSNESISTFTPASGAVYFRVSMRTYDHGVENCYCAFGSDTTFAPYSNICPISGRTGLSVYRTGKNLFDKSTPISRGQYVSGSWTDLDTRITTDFIPFVAETEYTMSIDLDNSEDLAFINFNYFDENKTWLGDRAANGDSAFSGQKTKTFTIHNPNAKFIRITCRAYSDTNLDIQDKTLTNADLMLELGSTATTYEPYTGTTYAVDWTSEAGTVYGGTLDVVTGVLTVDRANIASYNGEVINEPWLSSMDAYVAGATPTTGAQVVYTLATPLTYQLTPTQVALILGQNYVWSDSNESVTLTYVIKLFTRYTFIVNGNDYTGLVERDSYRTAVTPVYGETVQTLDGVNHTALLRLRGSITVGLNPQTKANTAAICADLLQSPVEVQYHCLQRNANVTALMVADTISAQFLSRCLYGGASWNQLESITLKEL